jgi:hypothetical protein
MAYQWPSMNCLCAQCRQCCYNERAKNDVEAYDVWVRRNSPIFQVQESVWTTKSLGELNTISSDKKYSTKKVRLGITTVYGSTQSLLESDLARAQQAVWQFRSSIPRLAAASSQPIAASSEGYNFICNCDEKRSHSCDPHLLKRGILRDNSAISSSVNNVQIMNGDSNQTNSRFSRSSRPRRNLREFARNFQQKMSRGFRQVFKNGSGGRSVFII